MSYNIHQIILDSELRVLDRGRPAQHSHSATEVTASVINGAIFHLPSKDE